jgi:hypothetical protein
MYPLRAAVPLALAACAVAAAPAAAKAKPAPIAHVAGGGGGAPPPYPGLVNNRRVRAHAALDRATNYADDGDTDKAVASLYTARLQVKLAWRSAKYVIQHAPPPAPPGDDLVAHMSGGAPAGGTVADQYATAGAVLDLQHSVAQTAIGMIDTAHGALRDSLSRTIFTALDQRDTAVAYIHSIDVPPPVGDDLVAHMSGGAVGGSWASIMPTVGSAAGDEIDQIDGAMDLSSTLGTGVRGVLRDAELQVLKTQKTIDQYWPPLPADDLTTSPWRTVFSVTARASTNCRR